MTRACVVRLVVVLAAVMSVAGTRSGGVADATEAAPAATIAVTTCGNGVLEPGEDCDDGGTCRGGTNAGTHCQSEGDCTGNGVCGGGTNVSRACTGDADCPGSQCIHCVPEGGDGCAANCTTETQVSFRLIEGVASSDDLEPGTSGAIAHASAITIALPLRGMQGLIIGRERDGVVPVVLKAANIQFPPINVGGLVCGCIRSVAAKTCGGTAFNLDGRVATDCTDGYTDGASACPEDKPCAFVHGEGNSGAGFVGCDGLAGIDVSITQDDLAGTPSAPVLTLSGSGSPGSVLLLTSTAIGTQPNACKAESCTDAEDFSKRGTIQTVPLTSGTASGLWTNANGRADQTICRCPGGDLTCPLASCLGPWSASGAPVDCMSLMAGSAAGGALAGGFPVFNLPILHDAVITNAFAAFPGPLNTLPPTPTATPSLTPTASQTVPARPSDTPSPSPSQTETASPEPTETAGPAVCGNGLLEGTEECDPGGTCLGGMDAGQACTAEGQCRGDGVCLDGDKIGTACADDSDCPGSVCRRCVVQGGSGCAANCTNETPVSFPLVPGILGVDAIVDGTSGALAHGSRLTVPLPLQGMQTLLIGRERDGQVPVTIKADAVQFQAIDVGGLVCGCIRGVAMKTCGGTVFDRDGNTAIDCTPGYTAGDTLCPSDKPCAFVHGPGNAVTGVVGCDGLAGVDVSITQDNRTGTAAAPVLTRSGMGPPGSAFALGSRAISTKLGACDATFCSDDQPINQRGQAQTSPFTTGRSSALWTNANGTENQTICHCVTGALTCKPEECIEPWAVQGAPVDCANLLQGNVSGVALASSFTAPSLPVLLDSVVTTVLVASPGPLNTVAPTQTPTETPSPTVTPTATITATAVAATPTATQPPCNGDCDADLVVTQVELQTLVQLDLLDAGSTCIVGNTGSIRVADILRAVNDAAGPCRGALSLSGGGSGLQH